MANPRKFSEKIALHNQKQAEETAAFEQIMREVIGVRVSDQFVYQLGLGSAFYGPWMPLRAIRNTMCRPMNCQQTAVLFVSFPYRTLKSVVVTLLINFFIIMFKWYARNRANFIA